MVTISTLRCPGDARLGMRDGAMREPLTAGAHEKRSIAVRAMGRSNVGCGYLIWAVMVAMPTRSPPVTASIENTVS
jgi:hypothetical protein